MDVLMRNGAPANKRILVARRNLDRALAQVTVKYGAVELYVVQHGDYLAIYWRVD